MRHLRDNLANRKTKSNLEAAYTSPSLPFQSSFDDETPPPSKKLSSSPGKSANKVGPVLLDNTEREPTEYAQF